jgi:hypothetical protein
MQAVQGNLVMIGLNTDTPQYFWNGVKLNHVVRLNAEVEADEHRIKLIVSDPLGEQSALYTELLAQGVNVKQTRGDK